MPRREQNLEQKHLVAVYGSLLSGMGNNYILQRSVLKGEFESAPNYVMFSLGAFPALRIVDPRKGRSIYMEIWEVNDATLQRLNNFESYIEGGNANFYERTTIPTPFGIAYMYYMTDENLVHHRAEATNFKNWKTKEIGAPLGMNWAPEPLPDVEIPLFLDEDDEMDEDNKMDEDEIAINNFEGDLIPVNPAQFQGYIANRPRAVRFNDGNDLHQFLKPRTSIFRVPQDKVLSSIKNVTVGSDFEVFLYDTKLKDVINAKPFVKGKKEKPYNFDKTSPFWSTSLDNVLAEGNIPPTQDVDEFDRNIVKVLNFIKSRLPETIKIFNEPAWYMNPDFLKNKEAKAFGRVAAR